MYAIKFRINNAKMKKLLIILGIFLFIVYVSLNILFWYIGSCGERYLPKEKPPIIDKQLSNDLLNIFWISLGGKGKREMVPIKLHHYINLLFQKKDKMNFMLNKSSIVAGVLTKMLIVSSKERYVDRNIQQISSMIWISKNWNIDKALSIIIHFGYYGKGVYGIKKAANYYFNKSLDNLTIQEIAILSVIAQAPNTYFNKYELLLKKSNFILMEFGNSGPMKKMPKSYKFK